MVTRIGKVLLTLCLTFSVFSCTKIQTPGEPTIAIEKMVDFSSVPAKWGPLIFVSNRPDIPHVFNLWFQDSAGTIRMVKYNNNTDQLLPKVILISRKGEGENLGKTN
jgi:hypothetical protein